jgi:hypothetical protein
MLSEWQFVRESAFGYEHEGRTDRTGYRFLKANLIVAMPDGDGSEGQPDSFHFACRRPGDMKMFIDCWDDDENGPLNPLVMENVPVRLIIREDQGDEPFTGNWDGVPWEEA